MGPSSTLVQGCYENWARVAVDVCVAHGERASAARPRQRFRYTRAFSVGSLGSLVSKPLQLRVLHQISLLAGQTWTQEEMEPASVLALMVVLALTQKQGYPLSLVQAPASHLQPPVQGEWPPYATCKTFSVSVDKKRTKTDTGSTKIYSFKNGSRKILPHSATAFIHASLSINILAPCASSRNCELFGFRGLAFCVFVVFENSRTRRYDDGRRSSYRYVHVRGCRL